MRVEASRCSKVAEGETCLSVPFVRGYASENNDHTGKTGERDRDLCGDAKCFARFHHQMISTVHGELGKIIFQNDANRIPTHFPNCCGFAQFRHK
jgi:hypothetical protein